MRTDFRTGGYRLRFGSPLTPAIKALIIINCATFFLPAVVSLVGGRAAVNEFRAIFGLVPSLVLHGYVWQPVTYLFLHGDFLHLLLNMLVLWMFGGDLERLWGKRKFLSFYFLCGVGAALLNILVKVIFPSPIEGVTVGASGAIYGLLMAMAVLFPDRQMWLIPFPVMVSMRMFALIMGAFAFFSSLGAAGDGISHISHLGGMLVGWLYLRRGSYFYTLRNTLNDWQRRRMRRKFEVYMRDHRNDPPSRPDQYVN